MNTFTSTKLTSMGEEIDICINEEVVASISERLAVSLEMASDSVSKILSLEEAKACFIHALKEVLAQDSGCKPSRELVPQFLSDITMPLNGQYRGVRIRVTPLSSSKRPDSYERFLDVMTSLQIPVGKILKVDPAATSNVLKIGMIEIQGDMHLIGSEMTAEMEELVVRSMLNVAEESQDKLNRILGHLDNLYVSRDELVRQWACSLPVGKR